MKLKIIRSSKLGFVTNHDGEEHEVDKTGNEYWFTAKQLRHLHVRQSSVDAGHAEIVKEEDEYTVCWPLAGSPCWVIFP